MQKVVFILIITIITLLQGCREKEILIDIPFEGKKLVVNGFFSPNEEVEVNISALSPIKGFSDSSVFVKDAIVILFENDKQVEILKHFSSGTYKSINGFKIKKGQIYHVEVQAKDFLKAVSHKDSIPSRNINLKSATFIDSVATQNTSDVVGSIVIKFDDLPTSKNYYSVKFIIFDNNKTFYINPTFSQSFLGFGGLSCEYYDFFHSKLGPSFSNKCFKGKNQSLALSFWTKPSNSLYTNTDSVRLHFHTLSKNTFDYIQSLSAHYASRDLWATPSNVLSNIQNGYGFIGFYDTDSLTLKL